MHHFFIQSEVKPKPIVTCSHLFSCALHQLHVISASFDWWIGLSVHVICDWLESLVWFWFYDTQLKTALLQLRNSRSLLKSVGFCCCPHHQNKEQQIWNCNTWIERTIWYKVGMINNKQTSINTYLSWTVVVYGHIHKSGGLSPNQKTKCTWKM